MKFEVGERVQVIAYSELKTGVITDLYKVDALVKFDSGDQKDACIPFAYMMKLDQPEPVIVRKFVAEWYEDRKHRLDAALWDVVGDLYIGEITDIQNFIFTSGEKIETLSAMKNGYVVAEEKEYYVEFPGAEFPVFLVKTDDGGILFWSNTEAGTKFTEQEIKELDERYWAFAVPVEELEAE